MNYKRKPRHIPYRTLAAILVMLLTALTVAFRLHYEKPVAGTAAVVEELHVHALTATGGDTLLTVVTAGGDTCVALPTDSAFLRRHLVRRPASWVNRWWLPSCRGTVAVLGGSAAAPPTHRLSSAGVTLAAAVRRLSRLYSDYYGQQTEVDYYLRTHSIHDEGYDIVVRRQSELSSMRDSLLTLLTRATRLSQSRPMLVAYDRYTIVADTLRLSAHPIVSHREGYQLYRADDGHTPTQASPVYLHAAHLGDAELPAVFPPMPPDTIVFVISGGGRRVWYPDGTYYEGDTRDTVTATGRLMRHGGGVLFTAAAIRPGLWKEDKYRGEQPTYTARHIYGIDISRYQHEPGTFTTIRRGRRRIRRKNVYPIDWTRLRITSLGTLSRKKVDGAVDYKISFIYIKNTEGTSIRNRYYASDYSAAKRHGFRVGSYHFFSTRTSAVAQARYFLSCTRWAKGDMPPVLDVEPSPKQVSAMGGAGRMLGAVRAWLVAVEARLGVRPVVYVSQTFASRYLNSRYADGERIRRGYQVWIARYGEYKPDVHLAIWQLCPDGRVSGIHGKVDINVFNGYAAAFRDF